MAENSSKSTKRIERRDIGALDVLNHGDGFLRAKVRFARAGVFPYVIGGKTVYEAKLPEEIFSLSTIDSAKRVPVTDGHPNSLVSSSNYADHVRGRAYQLTIEELKQSSPLPRNCSRAAPIRLN